MSACSLKRPSMALKLPPWRPASDAPASDNAENANMRRCVLDRFSYGSAGVAAWGARSCWSVAAPLVACVASGAAVVATAGAFCAATGAASTTGVVTGSMVGARSSAAAPYPKSSASRGSISAPTSTPVMSLFMAAILSMSSCVNSLAMSIVQSVYIARRI